jgi:hypothetical protein
MEFKVLRIQVDGEHYGWNSWLPYKHALNAPRVVADKCQRRDFVFENSYFGGRANMRGWLDSSRCKPSTSSN